MELLRIAISNGQIGNNIQIDILNKPLKNSQLQHYLK